jgi:CelD/BcsL family acetyltransferase involved in cellulose biosynthesis
MLEIIDNKNKLLSIKTEWNRLADFLKTPLLSFDWFKAAIEAFHGYDNLNILIIRESEFIRAIAPLVIINESGVKYLQIPGVSRLYEPAGFLYESEEQLRLLLTHVIDQGVPVVLQRVSFTETMVQKIRVKMRYKALIIERNSSGAYYLPPQSDWETYYHSISSRRRYDHRRAIKRAREIGKLDYEIRTPNAQNLSACLKEAIKIEATGWKSEQGSAIQNRKDLATFFNIFLNDAAEQGMVRIAFFAIDGYQIAMLIALECYDRFWILKIGYDETYSSISPGILLLYYCLQYSTEKKLAVEFLGAAESWIGVWTDKVHDFKTIIYYPFTLKGLAGIWGDIKRKFILIN